MMSPCRTLLSKSFHLAENSPATEANRYGPFGRLCARVVLHLLGKEKMGREPQLKDETLESFGERFCRELMGHEAEATQQSQNEDSQASEVVDVRNMRAVDTALLQNQHMHLEEWYLDRIIWMELYKESLRNNLYLDSIVYTPHVFSIVCTLRYTCSKEHGSKLFQFVEAKDEHLVLVHKPLFADPESVNVEFADLKKWRLSKQKPPRHFLRRRWQSIAPRQRRPSRTNCTVVV